MLIKFIRNHKLFIHQSISPNLEINFPGNLFLRAAQKIIGPYIFKDHSGNVVTVNAERYLQMLNEYLFPKLVEKGMDTSHFQQDGATCHTARISMTVLRNKFPGKVISLWGYLKSKLYSNNPTTLEDLKSNIRNVTSKMSWPQQLKRYENIWQGMADI